MDCCLCVFITMTIVLLVLSVKTIESKQQESWYMQIEQSEQLIERSYQNRKRCEVECEEAEPSPSNF